MFAPVVCDVPRNWLMKKVLFSSIDGGSVHQGLILAQLDEIMTIAQATSDIITLEGNHAIGTACLTL
jgi:hypothetical protein